jgi:hypothetical protein
VELDRTVLGQADVRYVRSVSLTLYFELVRLDLIVSGLRTFRRARVGPRSRLSQYSRTGGRRGARLYARFTPLKSEIKKTFRRDSTRPRRVFRRNDTNSVPIFQKLETMHEPRTATPPRHSPDEPNERHDPTARRAAPCRAGAAPVPPIGSGVGSGVSKASKAIHRHRPSCIH